MALHSRLPTPLVSCAGQAEARKLHGVSRSSVHHGYIGFGTGRGQSGLKQRREVLPRGPEAQSDPQAVAVLEHLRDTRQRRRRQVRNRTGATTTSSSSSGSRRLLGILLLLLLLLLLFIRVAEREALPVVVDVRLQEILSQVLDLQPRHVLVKLHPPGRLGTAAAQLQAIRLEVLVDPLAIDCQCIGMHCQLSSSWICIAVLTSLGGNCAL